ncbi:hypothetical protein B296_00047630 [Ensete ventricosum]|uniref:Uncharacterized protein n=1 Tax=Ensete ventricosum TaxID=4639 RepID=A0A426YHK6_ENSVE|nr:hypothetical protein B296_00047630 [Ensete ventricosum]
MIERGTVPRFRDKAFINFQEVLLLIGALFLFDKQGIVDHPLVVEKEETVFSAEDAGSEVSDAGVAVIVYGLDLISMDEM